MANLTETNEWAAGVYQIEETDPVLGGAPNAATGAGMVNIPHQQLAKRTTWLKTRVDTLLGLVVAASTTVAGIVRLNTSVSSTSTTEAATPSAVKAANDNANGRVPITRTVATSGLATGGGTLEAPLNINVPASTQAQAEAGADNTTAMTPLRAWQAIAAVLGGRSIGVSGLATGGGTLAASRTIGVPASTQAQAQAGADNTTAMTPLRVWQAIAARLASTTTAGIVQLSNSVLSTSTTTAATSAAVKAANDNAEGRVPMGRTVATSGLATGGGTLEGPLNINVLASSQAQAQAGTNNTTAMTPQRVRQAIPAERVEVAAGGLSQVALLCNDGADVLSGGLAPGTSLRFANVDGPTGAGVLGTWKCLGHTPAGTVGLFRRVA